MKKPRAPRELKPYTPAQMKGFILSALRRAHGRWAPRRQALWNTFVRQGANPATGRNCYLHQCPVTNALVPKRMMEVDHIEPMIPLDGKWGRTTKYLGVNWNELLPRLFLNSPDLYQAMSKEAHKAKTKEENKVRRRLSK